MTRLGLGEALSRASRVRPAVLTPRANVHAATRKDTPALYIPPSSPRLSSPRSLSPALALSTSQTRTKCRPSPAPSRAPRPSTSATRAPSPPGLRCRLALRTPFSVRGSRSPAFFPTPLGRMPPSGSFNWDRGRARAGLGRRRAPWLRQPVFELCLIAGFSRGRRR